MIKWQENKKKPNIFLMIEGILWKQKAIEKGYLKL